MLYSTCMPPHPSIRHDFQKNSNYRQPSTDCMHVFAPLCISSVSTCNLTDGPLDVLHTGKIQSQQRRTNFMKKEEVLCLCLEVGHGRAKSFTAQGYSSEVGLQPLPRPWTKSVLDIYYFLFTSGPRIPFLYPLKVVKT